MELQKKIIKVYIETLHYTLEGLQATKVIPEVLQSDNGVEFLEECIRMIRKHFGTIIIVKGKARKPSTQGSVERSNAPFKRSLFEWIEKNPGRVGQRLVPTWLMLR
jgi:hypothetical protein